ncbi:MAG: hypothetical protein ACI9KI_001709, partial [Patiriisocius sp.]
MKKLLLTICCFSLFSCAELQQVVNTLPNSGGLDQTTIGNGLRQALDLGIDK